jgi:hypothetical protein
MKRWTNFKKKNTKTFEWAMETEKRGKGERKKTIRWERWEGYA